MGMEVVSGLGRRWQLGTCSFSLCPAAAQAAQAAQAAAGLLAAGGPPAASESQQGLSTRSRNVEII